MPKIKDLGITTLAFAPPSEEGARGRGYWLCTQSCATQSRVPEPPCHPTPPQCHPTQAAPSKKNAPGVPQHAVAQIKRQIHEIRGQLQ
jgi:hypothetical protein